MDQELDELLEKARNHKMTPAQYFEQRLSFIASGMPEGTSREKVRAMLVEQYGDPVEHERDKAKLAKAREALEEIVWRYCRKDTQEMSAHEPKSDEKSANTVKAIVLSREEFADRSVDLINDWDLDRDRAATTLAYALYDLMLISKANA
ncbi:MAG: hypothetical protein AAGB23_05120 [Pseudomonadota bacterium]